MGKFKVCLYFYLTVDSLTNVLQQCSLSSPLPTILSLSKPLTLVGCHGIRNAILKCNRNFLTYKIYSILAELSLHSCTLRCALWPMSLWFCFSLQFFFASFEVATILISDKNE